MCEKPCESWSADFDKETASCVASRMRRSISVAATAMMRKSAGGEMEKAGHKAVRIEAPEMLCSTASSKGCFSGTDSPPSVMPKYCSNCPYVASMGGIGG